MEDISSRAATMQLLGGKLTHVKTRQGRADSQKGRGFKSEE